MNNSVKKLNKAAMTGVFKSDRMGFKLSKYLSVTAFDLFGQIIRDTTAVC
jgi:hypothetical protein